MKTYLSLILTAIILSFVTAYFALNLQKDQVASSQEIQMIKDLEKKFQVEGVVLLELDLSSMYPTRDAFQLLQPIVNTFNQTARYSIECGKASDLLTKNPVRKREIWEIFRCQRSNSLPVHFFEFSPLISESGESFAYLAYNSGIPPFNDLSWVKKHLNFFHVTELHFLPPEALDPNFKILSTFDLTFLEFLVQGEDSFLTDDYYLAKKEVKSASVYKVYSKLSLEKFLGSSSYSVSIAKAHEHCYFQVGNLCWQKDSVSVLAMLRPSSILIFITSVLILILVSLSLYSRIKLQNHEEERKRHALRVLTHELRTPITNLMLQIERLNKCSGLDPIVQEELLRMEGEVYCLKRLAEKSSNYLSAKASTGLIHFEQKEISSFNQFLQGMLEPYREHQIEEKNLQHDMSLTIDPYWFNICFKNLIENALAHGKKPISVVASTEGQFIRLDVLDNGQNSFPSLEAMFEGNKSESPGTGLGMGLSIVQKIMNEMGGKLSFNHHPTKFSLWLRIKT